MADANTNTAPTKQLKSWDAIVADPAYQALSATEKAAYQGRYEQAGGTAEETGVLGNIANAVEGAGTSIQHGVVHGFTGALEAADTAANKMLGMAPSSVSTWAQEQREQYDNKYEERVAELHQTPGGKLGLTVGQPIADIAGLIAAPEVAIPYMVGRTFGESYGDQKPDAQGNKSFTKATTDAAINYALNKIPGGSSLTKTLLPEAKNIITQTAKGLIETGEQSLKGGGINAAGGYASEFTHAIQEGQDVSTANKRAVERAGEDFTTGAAFAGLAHGVPMAARGGKQVAGEAVQGVKNAFKPKPNVHPDLQNVNAKIETEHNAVNDPDLTPEQRVNAYDNAPNKRANDTVNAFDAHGFKAKTEMVKGDQATADILGTSEKSAPNKIYNAKEKADELKTSLDSMNKSITTANQNNKNLQKSLKDTLKGSEDAKHVDEFFDATGQIQRFHNNSDAQSADVQAIRAQKALDNMGADTRAIIEQHYITPKGFGDTVDPIGFSKTYGDVLKKASDLNTQYRGQKESRSLLDAYDHAPGFIKGVVNLKTMGGAEAVSQAGKITNFVIGARRAKAQAKANIAAQERQAQIERTQQNPNQANPEMQTNVNTFGAKRDQARRVNAANEWHTQNDTIDADLKRTVNSSTIDDRAHLNKVKAIQDARNSITDKELANKITLDTFKNKQFTKDVKKLDTERNKIVDPALRKQLTLDNINDTLHVNGIKKQDRIQNRETTEEKLKRQAEENRKKRDIIDAEEQAKLDRFRQGAGRNYSKSDLNEAIKATTQGGKALNSDRVINHLTKIADKSNMPGSKEWFKNSVQKMKHVSDADKAGMKSEISKTFANGTPSPNELKTLSNQLGDWESQIHTSNNRKSFADSAKAEAQARNEQMETHGKAVVKANQVSEVHDAMEKAFKGVDVPEYKKSDFIRRHTNKVFKDGEKSQAQQATAIKEATQAAKEYAQRVQRGKPGEPEPAPEQGQGEPTGQPETKAGESTNKPADTEPLPKDEVDSIEQHSIEGLRKEFKGKSVSEIQHAADLAREKIRSHLSNNPEVMKDMITGINAYERLSIRLAENPGKDIRDVIKQNDIMGIKVAQNSGVKGLIFHAITGKNFDASRSYLLGEGETVASRSAEKETSNKSREGALKATKTNAQRFGVGNMPKKKVRVKTPEPDEGLTRTPTRP